MASQGRCFESGKEVFNVEEKKVGKTLPLAGCNGSLAERLIQAEGTNCVKEAWEVYLRQGNKTKISLKKQ